MDDIHLWLIYATLLLSALVLYLPVIPRPVALSDTEIGYLRGGPRGAVLTALTALRADGVIERRRRGGVRRTNRGMPSGGDDLERAVYGALHTAAGPRSVAAKPTVRRALTAAARRLAGAGLIAGPLRRMVGRAMLIAVPIAAIVRLTAGGVETVTVIAVAAAVLAAAGLWLPSRRTIAGHGVLHLLRHQHARLVAEWTTGEHNPHDASLDAQLDNSAVTASRASLLTKGLALGLVIDLVAVGIQAFDSDGGAGGDFDGDGGFDGGDFGWDGGGWDGGDFGSGDSGYAGP
jgi:uncharacterized protein (TIGR04222 family)